MPSFLTRCPLHPRYRTHIDEEVRPRHFTIKK